MKQITEPKTLAQFLANTPTRLYEPAIQNNKITCGDITLR